MSRDSAALPRTQGPGGSPEPADVRIRTLCSAHDFRQCVELQRSTWGATYGDVVPASVLQITHKVGGVVLGAFDEEQLVGFAYGLTGVQGKRLVHWSHMLAVKPEYRNRGIGAALKQEQRGLLRELGVEEMQWTFDPLVARNAHLNLRRLGVRVLDYICDLYGDTGSILHSFGTDRMVVGWSVTASHPVSPQAPPSGPAESAFPFTPDSNPPEIPTGIPAASTVLVPVPRDIEALAASNPEAAMQWRRATRAAFTALLRQGFHVSGFVREPHPHFVLVAPGARGA